MLTDQKPSHSDSEHNSSFIEFRVTRVGRPTRRMRLAGKRYTLGSGPESSIRLDDGSLQPIHAVLECGSDFCRVQAAGDPLLVNGVQQRHAKLFIGDHVQVGSYTFELAAFATGEPYADAPAVGTAINTPISLTDTTTVKDNAADAAARLSFAEGFRLREPSDQHATRRLAKPDSAAAAANAPRTLDAPGQRSPNAASDLQQGSPQVGFAARLVTTDSDAISGVLETALQKQLGDVLQRFELTQQQSQATNSTIESMQRQLLDMAEHLHSVTAASELQSKQRAAEQQTQRKLIAELDQTKATWQQSRAELVAAQRSIQALTRERTEALANVTALTQRCAALTAQVERSNEACRGIAVQRDRLTEDLKRFSQQRQQWADERNALLQRCGDTQGQQELLREKLEQVTQERDDAIRQRDEAQARLAGHEQQIAQQQVTIHQLRQQVDQLQACVEQSQQEAEQLRQQSTAAMQSIGKLEAALAETETARLADRESWEQESNDLRDSIQQVSAELAVAIANLSDSNATADLLNQELEQTRCALQTAERELQDRPTVDDLEKIRQRLDSTERHLEQLQQEHRLDKENESAAVTDDRVEESDLDTTPGDANDWTRQPVSPEDTEPSQPPQEVVQPPSSTVQTLDPLTNEDDCGWPTYSDPFAQPSDGEKHPESIENLPGSENLNCDHETNLAPDIDSVDQETLQSLAPPEEYEDSEKLNNPWTEMLGRAAEYDPWSNEEQSDVDPETLDGVVAAERPDQTPDPSVYQADPLKALDSDEASHAPFNVAPHDLPADDDVETATVMWSDAFEQSDTSLAEELGPQSEPSESEQASTEINPPEVGPPEVSSPVGSVAAEDEPDDDSIEAYMNRLLQRVQGTSGPVPPASSVVAPHSEPPRQAGPDPSAAMRSDSARESSFDIDVDTSNQEDAPATPYLPRSQAPERDKNLSAMRELANHSARSAIATSTVKRIHSTVLQKFGIACGSVLAGSVFLYLSQMAANWQALTAVCLFLLAGFWLWEAAQMELNVRRQAREDEAKSEPGASESMV